MKSKLLALSIASSLFLAGSGVALAQSSPSFTDAGAFIGAQVGNAHWSAPGSSQSFNRFGYGLFGGQRFRLTDTQTLGWQIDAQDFGQPSLAVPLVSGQMLTARAKLRTYGVAATYRFRPQQGPWFVGATAGLERGTAHGSLIGLGSASTRANGYQVAANLGYSLTSNLDVSIGYQYDRFHFNSLDNHLDLGTAVVQSAWRF